MRPCHHLFFPFFFLVLTDRQVLLHPQSSNSRLIALSPFRNHFCVWDIVSKQWHWISNITAERVRETNTQMDIKCPLMSPFFSYIKNKIWMHLSWTLIRWLNHVAVMSAALNIVEERLWFKSFLTRVTGTQCLQSTPLRYWWGQSPPSATREPVSATEHRDSAGPTWIFENPWQEHLSLTVLYWWCLGGVLHIDVLAC